MACLLLLAASCKKEADIQNGAVSNGIQFQFTGRAGAGFLYLAAGLSQVAVSPVSAVNDRIQILSIGDDEQLFQTGSRFASNDVSSAPWRLSVFFALPSAAQITTGVYPVAVYDTSAFNTYSAGKAAVKLFDVNAASGGIYSSYHPLNSGSGGTVTVTAVQDYTENGRNYKKVNFSVNITVYKLLTTLPVPESLLVTGDGVAMF